VHDCSGYGRAVSSGRWAAAMDGTSRGRSGRWLWTGGGSFPALGVVVDGLFWGWAIGGWGLGSACEPARET